MQTVSMLPGGPTDHKHPWGDSDTPYLELGGDKATRTLVDTFYDIIEAESPTLRAMLPANTAGSRAKLYEYLSGWLGGPPLYTDRRGHPQLRRRHLPFDIGSNEAVEWIRCMTTALDSVGVGDPLREFLVEKLTPLAHHMENRLQTP